MLFPPGLLKIYKIIQQRFPLTLRGVSKGGESRLSPFAASKSFAFAQHINTQEFPRS